MIKKSHVAAAALVLLALWIGIGVGYHDGARAERLLWEATSECHQTGVASLGNAETFTGSGGPVYRNPHYGIVQIVYAGKPMVNVPDPRTYEQFSESPR